MSKDLRERRMVFVLMDPAQMVCPFWQGCALRRTNAGSALWRNRRRALLREVVVFGQNASPIHRRPSVVANGSFGIEV
ncbi:MAG: hypothetical protein AAGJ91_13485 [Pseudomonadota bacterium]